MIIVVSGPPGSGKTTQAKLIAEHYGFKYHSAGMIFRGIAAEKGLTLEELSILAAKDPSIDLEIDRRSREIALSHENIVVDGHLTAWVLSDIADAKILVTAPLMVRIARIARRDGKTLGEAARETIIREYYQWRRFIDYYGLEVNNRIIFDLVIDTGKLSVNDTFEIIKTFVEKLLKTNKHDNKMPRITN